MSCVFLTNKSDFHRNIYSYLLLIITASCDGVTASSIRCCVVNIRMCSVSLHFSTLGWALVPCPLPPPAAHRCVASLAYMYSSQPSSNITGGNIRCEAMENDGIIIMLLLC